MRWAEIIDHSQGVVRTIRGVGLIHLLFHTTAARDAYLATMPEKQRTQCQTLTRAWAPCVLAELTASGHARIVSDS